MQDTVKEENFFDKYSNYFDVLKNITFPLIQLRKDDKVSRSPSKKLTKRITNSSKINKKISYLLPKQDSDNKKTLVLDLDETLIHSLEKIPKVQHSYIQIQNGNNELFDVYIILRPGAKQFIQEMSKIYEIVIFTASVPIYANDIIDLLDETGEFISGRFFRDKCMSGGVKNLEQLERNLQDVIIIDNLQKSFELQPDNGLLIKTFIDDMTDYSLLELIPFLKYLSKLDDVRNVSELKSQYDEKIQSQQTPYFSKHFLSFQNIERLSTQSQFQEEESEDFDDDEILQFEERVVKLKDHLFMSHFLK